MDIVLDRSRLRDVTANAATSIHTLEEAASPGGIASESKGPALDLFFAFQNFLSIWMGPRSSSLYLNRPISTLSRVQIDIADPPPPNLPGLAGAFLFGGHPDWYARNRNSFPKLDNAESIRTVVTILEIVAATPEHPDFYSLEGGECVLEYQLNGVRASCIVSSDYCHFMTFEGEQVRDRFFEGDDYTIPAVRDYFRNTALRLRGDSRVS